MKKKVTFLVISICLCLAGAIGGAFAGFSQKTEEKGTLGINVKSLGLSIGKLVLPNEKESEAFVAVPGKEIALTYNVVNDTPEGYDLYTRVTIDKKWKNNSEGKLENSLIKPLLEQKEYKAGDMINGWIVTYSDDEQAVMYYTKPLAPGQTSEDFIQAVSFDPTMGNIYAEQEFGIEFKVDGVQKAVAKNAIPAEWGVYPTFDANGNITAIAE
ncbi:MAG: hypothetical protein K6F84_04300 [Lachnospiraceae bacterium]|nr:hypothetical protein [Lachnospiraceae bacterium]